MLNLRVAGFGRWQDEVDPHPGATEPPSQFRLTYELWPVRQEASLPGSSLSQFKRDEDG